MVEKLLADARREHPELEQVVLRIGTILGERVDNQITALFMKKRLLGIRGSRSPFVFIWDTDVAEIIQRAVTGDVTGTFNVAGDGALEITEIADRLGKQVLWLPDTLLKAVLAVGSRLGVSRYGPEQTRFLKHRPVLDTRLREVLGYSPRLTSSEAFDAWLAAHREAHA
jgi:UDP-glucose 4-epimerase